MLLANWTNTKPIVPIVVVPVHVAGIEVHVPRVVRVVRVERTRPVVAVAACVVERTVVAVACCRKQRGNARRAVLRQWYDSFQGKGNAPCKPITPSLCYPCQVFCYGAGLTTYEFTLYDIVTLSESCCLISDKNAIASIGECCSIEYAKIRFIIPSTLTST